mgnify:CR=1 FL=1
MKRLRHILRAVAASLRVAAMTALQYRASFLGEAAVALFWLAWTVAPLFVLYQHEAIAVWRAIENRRYFVRVGNAGVSGVVDPFGRVLDRLGMFTAETLQADVRPMHLETIYTRVGDVFGWTVAAVAVLWLILTRRRTT